jgi:hypothetical protein
LNDFIKLGNKESTVSAPGIPPDREKELLKKIEALSGLVVDLERQLKKADNTPETREKEFFRELMSLKKEIAALKKGSPNISVVLGGELEKG